MKLPVLLFFAGVDFLIVMIIFAAVTPFLLAGMHSGREVSHSPGDPVGSLSGLGVFKMKARSGKIVLVLAISLLVIHFSGVFAQEESSPYPPTDLKLVGDHWTPWDPPEAGPDSYIIVKGDTLWDLAGKWLDDPFLWPQVWDENRYILDSHWIYPGDPLVVPGRPTVVPPEGPDDTETAQQDQAVEQPVDQGFGRGDETEPEPEPVAPPVVLLPVANASDLYCSGYIDPEPEPSDVRVAGGEIEREFMGQGDVLYLNYGLNQGVKAGDEMAVRRVNGGVTHPVTGEILGSYVQRLGKVRVIAVQENTSTALITESCLDIVADDQVVEGEEIPIPARAVPVFDRYDVEPSGNAQGYMVMVRDRVDNAGEGHVIYTDLGMGSGVAPGDILTVYRDNGDLPRRMIGQAVILTVEQNTSTAMLVTSVSESGPGDRVEVR